MPEVGGRKNSTAGGLRADKEKPAVLACQAASTLLEPAGGPRRVIALDLEGMNTFSAAREVTGKRLILVRGVPGRHRLDHVVRRLEQRHVPVLSSEVALRKNYRARDIHVFSKARSDACSRVNGMDNSASGNPVTVRGRAAHNRLSGRG